MRKLTVNTKIKKSQILIGKLQEIYKRVNVASDPIYITDENLNFHYKDFLREKKVIVIQSGEVNKNLATMDYIYEELIRFGADRKSFIIGFGGGMVTDIAGFAASTYMRGIEFGFIPTSLLAMVDASIGGKNGVNHNKYKNMIGTFNQPEFVLIDPYFLQTLPDDEYLSGMGEALKHLLINNKNAFYNFIENSNIYLDKSTVTPDFLYEQIKVKVDIVNNDEKESGERKKLNFGHTFGHAIEKISGMKHGFSVSIGMVIAAKLSQKLGFLSQNDVNVIIQGLKKADLPTIYNIPNKDIIKAMHKDKKKDGDNIDFIVLESIGNANIISLKMIELESLFLKD